MKKGTEYIHLQWDGEPEFRAVRGHVEEDGFLVLVKRETEIDLTGNLVYREYLHLSPVAGCQAFSTPKKGRVPVTICYV